VLQDAEVRQSIDPGPGKQKRLDPAEKFDYIQRGTKRIAHRKIIASYLKLFPFLEFIDSFFAFIFPEGSIAYDLIP